VVTTFVIVQHAEKESQPGDPGLTPNGRRQAAEIGRALRSLGPTALYSSPLRRAAETAAGIGTAVGLPVVPDPALTERMNWTAGSGLSLEEFLREWEATTRDRHHAPRCGDSSLVAGARFERALRGCADAHPHATVIVVTHGGVTTDFLRTVTGDEHVRELAPDIIDGGVPPGAFTTIRRTSDSWVIDAVASTAHLDGLRHWRP
jgi:broad specificity phosphatase PhoE